MEKTEFIMKPKVDFCFKELMEDSEVRKGFISAVLKIDPTEVVAFGTEGGFDANSSEK